MIDWSKPLEIDAQDWTVAAHQEDWADPEHPHLVLLWSPLRREHIRVLYSDGGKPHGHSEQFRIRNARPPVYEDTVTGDHEAIVSRVLEVLQGDEKVWSSIPQPPDANAFWGGKPLNSQWLAWWIGAGCPYTKKKEPPCEDTSGT